MDILSGYPLVALTWPGPGGKHNHEGLGRGGPPPPHQTLEIGKLWKLKWYQAKGLNKMILKNPKFLYQANFKGQRSRSWDKICIFEWSWFKHSRGKWYAQKQANMVGNERKHLPLGNFMLCQQANVKVKALLKLISNIALFHVSNIPSTRMFWNMFQLMMAECE